MSAETSLRAALLAAGAVTALVNQRVYPDRAEEGEPFPFVVFARTGSQPQTAMDGSVLATLVSLEVQCWADSFLSAQAVADAVATAVRAQVPQQVTGRAGGYDPDLGRSVASLIVEWWEIPA